MPQATVVTLTLLISLHSPGAGWSVAAQTGSAADADRLNASIAAAETNLKQGQRDAAERQFIRALAEGWTLVGSIEIADRRWPQALDALGRAKEAGAEPGPTNALAGKARRKDSTSPLAALSADERRALMTRTKAALTRSSFNLGILA